MAWTMFATPARNSGYGRSGLDAPRAEITASCPSTARATAATSTMSPRTTRTRPSAPSAVFGRRSKAVTTCPSSSACVTSSRPVPPAAPNMTMFISGFPSKASGYGPAEQQHVRHDHQRHDEGGQQRERQRGEWHADAGGAGEDARAVAENGEDVDQACRVPDDQSDPLCPRAHRQAEGEHADRRDADGNVAPPGGNRKLARQHTA